MPKSVNDNRPCSPLKHIEISSIGLIHSLHLRYLLSKPTGWPVKAYGNAIGQSERHHQAESLACNSLWQHHRKGIIIPIIRLKAWPVKAYSVAIGFYRPGFQPDDGVPIDLWRCHRLLQARLSA